MSALATVVEKSFNGKFTPKLIFRSGITIADTGIESLKSLHIW